LAVASPLVIPVTRAEILLRALSRIPVAPFSLPTLRPLCRG
jgi:hypothetical protein